MHRATVATFAAALAVTVAAGAANSANLRLLSADCDPSLAATMGQGTPGKICSAMTSRNSAGRVSYGAADGAFYPLGLSNGIVFDVDPAFAGNPPTRNAPADWGRAADAANPAAPGLTRPGGSPRAAGIGGGTPAAIPGNGLALGTGLPQTDGALPDQPLPPLSPLMPTDTATGPTDADSPDQRAATPAISPIPLPAAGWLLLAGLGALGLVRRRAPSA